MVIREPQASKEEPHTGKAGEQQAFVVLPSKSKFSKSVRPSSRGLTARVVSIRLTDRNARD